MSDEFKHPVYTGDVLTLYGETIHVGRTSARVRINVFAERFEPPCQSEFVTTAELVFVAIDQNRKPITFDQCRTQPSEASRDI